MKKLISVFGALLILLPAFASAATVQVSAGDSFFSAKNITINQGDTVLWTNNGNMAHTVTADNNSFDSGNMAKGQTYSRMFSTPGTYGYYCAYHGGPGGSGMAGTVTVQATAASASSVTNTQNASDMQSQAQALLQQVAALQAQLAAQGQTTGAVNTGNVTTLNTNPTGAINVSSATAVNNASCPNIGRVLKLGSSGADVTRLQQFLAGDPSIYPEGMVTGYFGALTEKAVQRWQVKYNVVSSGSAATTGYGVVGPRTAAAIALLCSTGGSSSPVGGYIQVSPISGNAPLNVNVVATVNSTNSCASAIYLLSWGDGTNPISIPVNANTCGPLSQTYQHTYAAGGTYQITLSAGSHQTGATIMVYGNSSTNTNTTTNTNTNTNTTNVPNETFNATPTSGSIPLTVTFSGIVTGKDQGWCSAGCSDILVFGDGQQGAVPLPTSQTGAQNYSITHTYTTAGTYTATLYQGQSGSGRPTVGSATITAGGATVTSFNAPSVTPGVNGNPLTVALSFDYSPVTCNYSVNWGDRVTDTSPGGCTGTGTVSKIMNHTYATAGSRTITLSRDGQTNTAAINIVQ